MRVLIISDIHGNIQALEAIAQAARKFDAVVCAGDIVNYGPSPRACIDWLREKDAVTVIGNHDFAVATAGDPKAASAEEPLALAMRDWTKAQLRPSEVSWLRKLPRQKTFEMGGAIWLTLHATPADPLYDYRLQPGATEQLVEKLTRDVQADVMVVGHTHLPFVRTRRKMQIVNPGSAGQPLDGNPQASYAIWEHGRITLERVSYDQEGMIHELQNLPLGQPYRDALCRTLRLGRSQTVK